VLDLPAVAIGADLYLADEVAFVAAEPNDFGLGQEFDPAVVPGLLDEILQVLLNIQPLDRLVDTARDPAQFFFLLHQNRFKTLPGEAESGIEAGEPAADHQSPLLDFEGPLRQRLQQRRPSHRHPHQILGLFRGFKRILLMHPGILIANVGHLEKIFIETASLEGILEELFMGARRAGRHHYPVQLLFGDDLPDLLLGILGAGKEIVVDENYLGQRCRIGPDFADVDHRADVDAAVADKHPDAGSGFRQVRLLGRQLAHLHAGAPRPGQVDGRCTGGSAGFRHRERDVLGPLEQATGIDSGPGSADRGKAVGDRKPVVIQRHPQSFRHLDRGLTDLHPH